MNQHAFSQLAFRRLDRARHAPALADADDLLLRHVCLDQCVQDAAQSSRIAPDLVQQARRFASRDDLGHLEDVVADVGDKGQVALLCEVKQARRNLLATLQHGRMRPCVRPNQPLTRHLVPADHAEPKQVVEATAVDAGVQHLRPFEEGFERDRMRCFGGLPEVGACPAVGPQVHADLDIQVLGEELLEILLAALQRLAVQLRDTRDVHRGAPVRVRNVGVCEILVRAVGEHRLRKLVDHRQEPPVLDEPIAHLSRVAQFVLEHPCRRLGRLRGGVDHEAIGPGCQAASRFQQHVRSLGLLAELVEFIDKDERRLLARNRIAVCGHHLQRRRVVPVRDGAEIVLHLQHRRQVIVRLDHVADRLVAVVRDFLRRRQDQQFSRGTPVQYQRSQHDSGRGRRLHVLLTDHEEELIDQPAARLRVVGAEDRTDPVLDPRQAGFPHGRLSGDIDQNQPPEDLPRLVCLHCE
ncbi:hypothetical protein D3C87_1286040 [compost metagenome]